MNPIVHFEILAGPGQDKKALQDFYAKTFGWTIDASNPMGYGIAMPGGPQEQPGPPAEGINGGIDAAEDRAKVLIYIGVDDPKAYLEKIRAAGGKVVQDVTVVPGMVTYATFLDPAGNEVGIVDASGPPPA